MYKETKSTFFSLLYNFFYLFEPLKILAENILILLLFDFEFGILDSMLLIKVGNFCCAIDYVAKLVDKQKLQIL